MEVTEDPRYVKQAINLYRTRGDFERAAELAQKIGDYGLAEQLRKESSSYAPDASLVQMIEQDMDLVDRSVQLKRRAQEAVERGKPERPIELYEEAGLFADAAKLAKQAGNFQKAFELYDKDRRFFDAALLAEEIGDLQRATVFYEKAGLFAGAAESAEKMGDIRRADAYRFLNDKLKLSY